MDAQREIVEQFKRDLPEIDAGRDPFQGERDFEFYRMKGQLQTKWCMMRGCRSESVARGMCHMHYQRMRRQFA